MRAALKGLYLMAGFVIFAIAGNGPAKAQAGAQQNHLRIVNKCASPVWIQQDGLTALKPVVEIAAGAAHDYWIARKGVPRRPREWSGYASTPDARD